MKKFTTIKPAPEGWQVGDALTKTFKFRDFQEAREFVNGVCDLSQQKNHHPQILWDFNSVTLNLVTHDAGGITQEDTELATLINNLIL